MSRKNVDIVISAVDQFTDTLTKATAALASLYGVYKLGEEAVAQAQEQENAEAKLAIALGKTSQALLEHAGAMQQSTKFGDDMVIQSYAAVAAFIKNEEQIKKVTAAAADFATAYGMDLVSASEMLTKSIASNSNMLGRYGMEVTGAAGSAERLNSVLDQINQRFGGQAAAQAQTFSGSVVRLKNAWGDLLEVFGNVIVRNPAVIKTIEILTGGMFSLGASANESKTYLRELVRDGLAFVIDVVGKGIGVVGAFHMAWEMMKVGVTSIVGVIIEGLRFFYTVMTDTVLAPFNLLFDALVKIDAIGSNPLKNMKQGLDDLAGAAWENRDAMLAHADQVYNKYDTVTQSIYEMAEAVRNTDVSQETEAGGVDPIAAFEAESEIRLELLTARYEAERELAAENDALSEEAQLASLAVFDMQQMQSYEKFAATTRSKAELEYLVETQKLQRQAFIVAQQMQLERIRAQAGMQALSNVMAYSQYMYQQGGDHARKYFSMYKAAATAQALIKTYESATSAYSAMAGIPYVGPILGALAAAAAVAAGLAQVSKIRSMSMDGGAGGGGNPYGTMTQPTAAPPTAAFPETGGEVPSLGGTQNQPAGPTQVFVTVNSPLATENWDQIAEKHIVPAINNGGTRGVQLNQNVVAAQ